ncbi:VOC family protein [Gordonia hirsuta]|nr:VOC family protein [Gordonia hirsuta]
MSPDPLSLTDVAITVAAAPAASAELYTALLGAPVGPGHWAASNASVTVRGDDEPAWAAFQVADLPGAAALLARRGRDVSGPDHAGARRLVSEPALGIVADAGASAGAPALDHVVFTAASVDAAVALFAGCLELNLRLIREFGELSQLFFRSGSTVVEVLAGQRGAAVDTGGSGDDQDRRTVGLWGVAWRCADLDSEHRRLTQAGLELSEIRTGRKPGTRVATIREHALGTPTILLEQAPRPDR